MRRRDEHGAVAVLVGFLAVALLVMCGFVIDFGQAYVVKRQLSTAADAASLAADAVYKTEYQGVCTASNDPKTPIVANANVRAHAEAAADSIFTQNYPQGTAADGNIADVSCKGAGVEVTYSAAGRSSSAFGPLTGRSGTITTQGRAAASYTVGSGICALCVLGNVNPNNADLNVDGGDIYVSGNVDTGPQSKWVATSSITISGTVTGLSQTNATPDYQSGPAITDPLAAVPLPSSPWTGLTAKSGSPCLGGPGVYGDYEVKNETCVLSPGAYVFTGALTFANTGSHMTSNGQPVTLFFAGPNGKLDVKNGDIANMAAPTTPPLPGWPAGFVIVYDRTNTNDLGLQGNGDSFPDVVGTVYALKAKVAFNGNSCFQVSKGPLVVGGVTGTGTKGCVNLTDTGNAGAGTPTGLHLTK